MTYEQIETFLTVVSRGSITAAASALFVTQSTVSSRIQKSGLHDVTSGRLNLSHV